MSNYASQIALADLLIREKGKPITVVHQVTITDVTKPWETKSISEKLDPAFGVFLNFNQNDLETYSKMKGASEIQISDRKVLIAAKKISEPITTSAKLRDESGDWSIEWVQVLSPNGNNILFTLRARK